MNVSRLFSRELCLENLYQEVLLEHAKRPRNVGEITRDAVHVHGDNPSGDEIYLHVRLGENRRVDEIEFTGQGCAISQASVSLMTTKLKGRTNAEAMDLGRAFHDLADPPRALGDLRAMSGVRHFPQRVKMRDAAVASL